MSYLRWVSTMLKAPEWRRKQWVAEIIEGFREYRPKHMKNPNDVAVVNENREYLSDMLEREKLFELVGFVPKIEYIKVEGREDELGVIWEHPHMNPQLLYKHKELPIFVIAGPGLRLNDSVLNEVGMRSDGVRGITG